MTHLELENLASDYLEGRLDAPRHNEAEAHLKACPTCMDLIAGLRIALEACHSAEELVPPPWLISKILLATVGERKPTWRDRVGSFSRPVVQPRFAYAVAMAVFSLSIIVNAAGLNLRNLTLGDLNPRTWIYRASSAGHLLYARAEKFYYDLRVVYEIESRFRQSQAQPQQPEAQPGGPSSHPGGSTSVHPPEGLKLALAGLSALGPPSGPGQQGDHFNEMR